MSKVKVGMYSAAAVIVFGMLTACGNSGANATSSNSNNNAGGSAPGTSSATLNIGLQAEPATLDPALSSALVDRQLMLNIYDTLFALTPQGTITGDLVKTWQVSSDGLTYTFTLRQGVKFTDGTPFNAQAVKFNLQRDMASTSARAATLSSVKSIDTPSTYTVVIHLSKPFSPLLGVLTGRAGMMVSPTAAKKEGSNFANRPVGSGPYEFVSQVKGSTLTLKANPSYWKGAPKIKNVVWHVFSDPNVELSNLESGALQLVDQVPASQLQSLKSNSNYVVSNTAGLGYQGIDLNTTTGPFKNVDLREAVDAAINRTSIVNVVFKGEASPGWSPFSPASPVYDKQYDTPPAPNPSKVKSLLKAAGDPNGFSFTLQTANSPVSVQVAQMIQSMLGNYGIKMQIQQLDFDTLLSNAVKHNFQATALGWSGRVDPDQDTYSFWYSGAPDNFSGFSNKQIDTLLEQARQISSMSQRKTVYNQFVQAMHKQDPYIFLYYPNNTYAYSTQLKGFQAYPDGVFRLDQYSLS